MAIPSLLGSYIDQTYQRIVQTTGSGTEFADGLGNPITFGTTNTGSLLTTASVVLNTITFRKGDGTTFPITVNTGSGGGASFPYTGSATITGSLVITGSTTSTLGFTGSLLGTASYVSGAIFTSTNPALSASRAVSSSYALSSSFTTTASYALNARAGGGNTQIQYNLSGSLTSSPKLYWDNTNGYLVNSGYYFFDFALTSGSGLVSRQLGTSNLLMQMGFNAQGQYGGTLGDISGNQFFVYNFQEARSGYSPYYWGFNNEGDNYWGSSNTRYSVKIQQPIDGATPDDGNIISLEVKLDNTDYTNIGGANSHIVLNNPNEGGQNSLSSVINGTVVAKWRTDYVGNINWVAGPGGSQAFYTGGDFGTGNSRMAIFNNGNVLIKSSGVGGANIDEGYKLDVDGTGRFTNNLQISGSLYVKPDPDNIGYDTPIAEFSNGAGYPIQILITDENLSSGYTAPIGSIGSSFGNLQLKYGTNDTEWANIEYQKYKVYTALLTQSSNSAPTAIELENTLGDITFDYDGAGYYFINSTFLFTANKTAIFFGNTNAFSIKIYVNDSSLLTIEVFDSTGAYVNGGLNNTPIEIRVYS